MHRILMTTVALAILVSAGVSSAIAQSAPTAGRIPVKEIVGKDVENLQGKTVGAIENVVVDRDNRNAAFAVIGVGGFLGIGDKEVAVPLELLREKGGRIILMSDRSEEALKALPAYERSHYVRPDD